MMMMMMMIIFIMIRNGNDSVGNSTCIDTGIDSQAPAAINFVILFALSFESTSIDRHPHFAT